MRIGLPGGGATVDRIVEQAQRAEADGFTSLWYASAVFGSLVDTVGASSSTVATLHLTGLPHDASVHPSGDVRVMPCLDGVGSGLSGLAERAASLHGTLEAGAKPDGGFRVRLAMPLGRRSGAPRIAIREGTARGEDS